MLQRGTLLGLMLAATGVQAQSIDLTLSDDSARFRYATVVWGQQYGRVEMEGGVLYNDDDNYLLNAGLHVYNDSWDSPLELGVGGRLYLGSIDTPDVDAGGLALGVRARYAPEEFGGFGIGGSFYYSPEIVSFSDAEHVSEYDVHVDYQIMPQANLYIGYRKAEVDLDDGPKVTLDKGSYFGVQIRY